MQLTLQKFSVGGIDTIPRGQYEAAKVLKFSPFDRVRYIILPQVTKIVLPSVFNEVMSLVKDFFGLCSRNFRPYLG